MRCQQVVGQVAANAAAMREVRARHGGADLILYPELQLIGYPPEDLVLKPALAERAADPPRAAVSSEICNT